MNGNLPLGALRGSPFHINTYCPLFEEKVVMCLGDFVFDICHSKHAFQFCDKG